MLSAAGGVRWWVTAGLLAGASVLLHTVNHGEQVVPRRPLRELSYQMGRWQGTEQPIEERLVQAVGVSEYTNRLYESRGSLPVQLYIGYYASQRTGDTIHSPKNCLPGAGWDPLQSGYASIILPDGRRMVVNEYLIAKGLDKQMVFYWYQGRGRVVASEYWGKFWMVADALTRHRTDGALVRLVTPLNDGEGPARERLVGFTQQLFPQLGELIPD